MRPRALLPKLNLVVTSKGTIIDGARRISPMKLLGLLGAILVLSPISVFCIISKQSAHI